jgi:hypothetical protein
MDERQGSLTRAAVTLAAATLSVAVVTVGCADPSRQVPSSPGLVQTIPSGLESRALVDSTAPVQPNQDAPVQPNQDAPVQPNRAQTLSPDRQAQDGDALPPKPKLAIPDGKTNGNVNKGNETFNEPQPDRGLLNLSPSNTKGARKGGAITPAVPPLSPKGKRKRKEK